MCRSIHPLFNFEPPATDDEVHAAALQFVRKVSGSTKPSRVNEDAFQRAVDEITDATHRMLDAMTTNAPPRDRDLMAARARIRAAARYGGAPAA